MKPKLFALVAIVLLSPPSWAVQPTDRPIDEITAQKGLPRADDTVWTQFLKCKIDYNKENGVYSIRMTPEVKALDGKAITVKGFAVPMDGSDQTKHFLLTRNTPVCLYCPPGEPNEVIEVHAAKAFAWSMRMVTVTGRLKLVNDEDQAIFFTMENAAVK